MKTNSYSDKIAVKTNTRRINQTIGKIILVFFLFILGIMPGLSAMNLLVPLEDEAYLLLEVCELRGYIDTLSEIRPYSTEYIINNLHKAANSIDVHAVEISAIQKTIDRLQPETGENPLLNGKIGFFSSKEDVQAELGISLDQNLSYNFLSGKIDYRSGYNFFLQGNYTEAFSYRIKAGVRLDQLNPLVGVISFQFPSETPVVNYDYTTPGEGTYFNFLGRDDGTNVDYSYGDGIAPFPVVGADSDSQLNISLFNDALELHWGMYARDWGHGSMGLLISRDARPFDALEIRMQLADWLEYTYITGSLTEWHDSLKNTRQNMLTMKRIEIAPIKNLKLSLFENVVWIKRFEMGYLNPFTITTLYQNMLGDFDNMYAGADFQYTPIKGLQFYGSVVVDEMNTPNPVVWFRQARNIFTLQAGAQISLASWVPGLIRLQYTKLEPFFYTHGIRNHASYSDTPMDTTYIHKGENIGYYLPPNSDEFFLSTSNFISADIIFETTIRYIRHSDQFGGSLTDSIDYDRITEYPEKNFTGTLTGHILAFSFSLKYHFNDFPLILMLRPSYAVQWHREVSFASDLGVAETFGEWSDPNHSVAASVGIKVLY
ncbi:MAG: hypothetical protein HQ557_00745 [Bacteroidetes bacterium]|nr:hypothetical protein [Bacteroidota bacterium]